MSFAPRLPTFNLQCRLYKLNALHVWVPDVLTTPCQLYCPLRNNQITWIDDFNIYRGPTFAGGDSQFAYYNIYCLFPKEALVRDPYQVWSDLGAGPDWHDYLEITIPPLPTRTYWIDQVEPRWGGFANMHLLAVCSRRLKPFA